MITADATTLIRQASKTADGYMIEAIDRIDRALGKDYAKNHPELISSFMHTAVMAKAIGEAFSDLAERITIMQGETLEAVVSKKSEFTGPP